LFYQKQVAKSEFMGKDHLIAEVGELLNGISGKIVKAVFIEWESGCNDAWMLNVSMLSQASFIPS
jgi:hypothetical protein